MSLRMKVTQLCPLFVTPWTIQSLGYSRPEYWSAQPFPSPGDLLPRDLGLIPGLGRCPGEGKGYPRQHIKKQRHYFADKCMSSQSYDFSCCHVQMSELGRKESELQRNDDLELWCWRRLLRVPWTERRFNQSILKEINIHSILIGGKDPEAEVPIL